MPPDPDPLAGYAGPSAVDAHVQGQAEVVPGADEVKAYGLLPAVGAVGDAVVVVVVVVVEVEVEEVAAEEGVKATLPGELGMVVARTEMVVDTDRCLMMAAR